MKRNMVAVAALWTLTACGSTNSVSIQSVTPTASSGVNSSGTDVLTSPDVAAVKSSVFKIQGATACGYGLANTGFLIGPQTVITNAHAVAGVSGPVVPAGSKPLAAEVIAYDPRVDVAILQVSGLSGVPLKVDSSAEPGQKVALLGYPRGGPLTVRAGRVLTVEQFRSPSIYGSGSYLRAVYALASEVQPGDSGGPVVDVFGHVIGVVFAASTRDPHKGYALTAGEVSSFLRYSGTGPNGQPWPPVSTGGCAH